MSTCLLGLDYLIQSLCGATCYAFSHSRGAQCLHGSALDCGAEGTRVWDSSCPDQEPLLPLTGFLIRRHVVQHPLLGPRSAPRLPPSARWIKGLALGLTCCWDTALYAEIAEKLLPMTCKGEARAAEVLRQTGTRGWLHHDGFQRAAVWCIICQFLNKPCPRHAQV